jgi:hypothetical protein
LGCACVCRSVALVLHDPRLEQLTYQVDEAFIPDAFA